VVSFAFACPCNIAHTAARATALHVRANVIPATAGDE
jgi:hypothetical protein